jgi:hypothetical protein
MKTFLLALALSTPLGAAAQATPPDSDAGFHARLYGRYCAKLRESPEAYVAFVKRMRPIYGYSFEEFAPPRPGAPVRADCGASPERLAAVYREAGKSMSEAPARR